MPRAAPQRSARRGAARAALRFVAAVLTTSGVLLIADASLTLAWQEPVSALVGWREQRALASELEAAEAAVTAEVDAPSARPRDLEAAAERLDERAGEGDPIGRIELPTLDRAYVAVEGTEEGTLRKGPGRYPDTALPGQDRTVAVAGHRTTYLAPFRTIDQLEPGNEIVMAMPYGRFTYEVQLREIVPPDRTSVTRDVGYDRLVLSACHPLYSAAERVIVYARLADAEPT